MDEDVFTWSSFGTEALPDGFSEVPSPLTDFVLSDLSDEKGGGA